MSNNLSHALRACIATGLLSLPLALPAHAADCSQQANQVLSQKDGQLLSAVATNANGQAVCQVTVLVQENGEDRPRKVTVNVPQ